MSAAACLADDAAHLVTGELAIELWILLRRLGADLPVSAERLTARLARVCPDLLPYEVPAQLAYWHSLGFAKPVEALGWMATAAMLARPLLPAFAALDRLPPRPRPRSLRQRLWTAAGVLRTFDPQTLAMSAGTSRAVADRFTRLLIAAGYLVADTGTTVRPGHRRMTGLPPAFIAERDGRGITLIAVDRTTGERVAVLREDRPTTPRPLVIARTGPALAPIAAEPAVPAKPARPLRLFVPRPRTGPGRPVGRPGLRRPGPERIDFDAPPGVLPRWLFMRGAWTPITAATTLSPRDLRKLDRVMTDCGWVSPARVQRAAKAAQAGEGDAPAEDAAPAARRA